MDNILDRLDEKRRAARAGRGRGAHRGAASPRQADRARADRTVARPRFLRGMGHVRRASQPRFRHRRAPHPGRRRRHRLRHGQRPAGLCVQPGFHRVRRLAERGACREDLQDHGPGDECRGAGDRAQRFRRGAHPGGRRLARRLCRGVRAQRAGLGRDPAGVADHGAMRRRRGLFAGDDRLHLHGQGHLVHVRDRPRGGEDRDPRERDPGGIGRRLDPYHPLRGRRPRLRERRRGAARTAPVHRFPAGLEPGAAAVAADRRPPRPYRAVARHPDSEPTRTSPTT